LTHKKNIIPILLRGFEFPREMPQGMSNIPSFNGVSANMNEYFDAAIQRLTNKFLLSKPIVSNVLKKSQKDNQNISAGDTIVFGGYNWIVLKVNQDKALILTTDIIENRPYNIEYEKVTWETCSLRQYLNNEFYMLFDDIDKEKISKTTLENRGNFEYKVDGGKDTDDRVFLLSFVEVSQYLQRQEDRRAKFNGNPWTWWLRSPGASMYYAAYVGQMGNLGENSNLGQKVTTEIFGVRPALWLKIE
jgi:hypothetical protein